MFFDPLVSWIVPAFCFLVNRIDTVTTRPNPTRPEPTYPAPHRDPKTGKIVIENNLLYKKDLLEHGSVQTMQWVKQGKYNLTPEELAQEHERLKKLYKL